MPQVVEIKKFEGAIWARIPLLGDEGRIVLLSDDEITKQEREAQAILDEIDRLRAALVSVLSLARDNPSRWTQDRVVAICGQALHKAE